MISYCRKRNGAKVPFDKDKISWAIYRAAQAVGGSDFERAEVLSAQVVEVLYSRTEGDTVSIESVQDAVEDVLIRNGHTQTSKAYILYREERRRSREGNALIDATIHMFSDYLQETDWRVRENANTQKSINGLNNYVREAFTKQYWLHEVYPETVRSAHLGGDLHLHDLGFFGPYCAGWDLRSLLMDGFGGVSGKVDASPPQHLSAFLGQIVNSTFTTQGETAGAQAWASLDTYAAPFIRADHLSYTEVLQLVQEFIYNLNVPTRVGFQCPFSNLTFDLTCPVSLREQSAIVGGHVLSAAYGDFQTEMDMFNRAFCEVMLKGDAKGRVFTFPIPTINVTGSLDWNGETVTRFMEIACKYGIPYFSNYVSSDLDPEDALSMCCRLRLDTKELRKRGGGLFGSNPMTGSIGVVTLNLPRIAYLSHSENEFCARLRRLAGIARDSLELKRKILEQQTARGLYPYSAHYLRNIKARTAEYWYNHFSTIGIVGMNEACRNFLGDNKDLTTQEGQDFALRTMDALRTQITQFQEETGHFYNLEATPAEGASYRLAALDRQQYPDILCAGTPETPYYTNSSQLPVQWTDDIFETLELQDALQCKYTGGTVLHLYLGERIVDVEAAKVLLQTIFSNYRLPYVSLTPTFSVCPAHGYLAGEHFTCPQCGRDSEVWSRVVGYLRPVQNYHQGKRQEYRDRIKYVFPASLTGGKSAAECR